MENLLVSWRHDLAWCHNVVVIASTWGSNPVRGVLEICDGENLWQWFRLEIRRKRLSWVNHSAKTIHHWRRGGGIFPGGGMRKFSASGGNCFSITTFLRSEFVFEYFALFVIASWMVIFIWIYYCQIYMDLKQKMSKTFFW